MNNKLFYIIVSAVVLISLVFWIYMFQGTTAGTASDNSDGTIELTMYHAEGCDCCVKWADYLTDNGFRVIQEKVPNLQAVKHAHNVPGQLSSCHTAIADGYVIEGHVPAEDIRRLLTVQPDAIGLAVPGMPPNSPGMDIPSDQDYHSVLFNGDSVAIFNTHN